jgi:hypothetical protein
METIKFKKLIKEAVKEAIQEELRDILLEAVKAPKATVVTESYVPPSTYAQPHVSQPKQLTAAERKSMFSGIIEEMQHGGVATTKNVPFKPQGPVDSINGKLPDGEVDLSQIMGLMNNR